MIKTNTLNFKPGDAVLVEIDLSKTEIEFIHKLIDFLNASFPENRFFVIPSGLSINFNTINNSTAISSPSITVKSNDHYVPYTISEPYYNLCSAITTELNPLTGTLSTCDATLAADNTSSTSTIELSTT